MIVANAIDEKNRKLIMFGLSRENITRLLADQPIHVSAETHGGAVQSDEAFLIFFRETEQEIVRDFLAKGLIHPGQLRVMPKGAKDQ